MLFPYQVEGVEFLKSHKQAFLFDDPGLGKTVQALSALDNIKPTLIVCPAVAKAVWQQEIAKWGFQSKVTVCQGRGSFRTPNEGEVVICNPDLLPDDKSFAWVMKRNTQLVVDEAHQYKSFTAKRSKTMAALSKAVVANNGTSWFMTGTPILSDPKDLYGLIQASSLSHTYRNWANFTYYFKGVNTRFGWKFPPDPRPDALKPLEPYMLRRRKKDVLPQLPEKIYTEFKVESDFTDILVLGEEDVVPSNTAGFISQWRAKNALAKAAASYDYVQSLIESGEQVVVFSAHTEAANRFGGLGSVITGATSHSNREAAVRAFQAGDTRVISGTIGAMGVAVTLTAACNVLFIDKDWNPAMNKQAEDRVCRIGQSRGVIVTDITSDNSTDKLVTAVLNRKTRLLENTFGI